mmetsp:Transcript_14470/g.17455  ORF Transcript_14470/g.17455 Transcript_14470/m.17455 type:complete len:259 (+) Transcript_14470:69-845(+)
MRFSLQLLAFLGASCTAVNGFAFAPARLAGSKNALFMSEPSDSSSENFINVESENIEPTETDELVASVMFQLPDTLGDVSGETRAEINEALLKLEAMNPTEAPALSNMLNGVWEMRYAAGYDSEWAIPSPTRQIALFAYSGGYSPGLFALSLAKQLPSQIVEVGDLEISISSVQPRIEASVDVKLFGVENEVTVKASLQTESDVRMRETYEAATVLDNSIDLPEAIQYSRDLYITYLDDDLMIVRDASGVPEVLVRKK